MAAISDPAIHGVWLPVDQFREYLHKNYSFGDNMQFNTNWLIRYLNKVFPNQSLESKEVTISTGKKVIVFRQKYQTKVKSRQSTGKTVSAVPKLPTYGNFSEWEEKCIPFNQRRKNTTYQLKRLRQKLMKDGEINQRVCCRYFGSLDLLTNWDWSTTNWMESRQDAFGFVQKVFLKSLMGNCLDYEEEETLCNTQPVSILQNINCLPNISQTFRCILSVILTRNNKTIACLFLPELARNWVLVAFLEAKNITHRVRS